MDYNLDDSQCNAAAAYENDEEYYYCTKNLLSLPSFNSTVHSITVVDAQAADAACTHHTLWCLQAECITVVHLPYDTLLSGALLMLEQHAPQPPARLLR